MKVKIYGIDMMLSKLGKHNIKNNESIISFSDSINEDIDFQLFHKDIDFICIHFPDVDYIDANEDELDKLFFEVNELISFIKSRIQQGKNFICQCYEGHSRSAATAAAILEYYEHDEQKIFDDPHYQPNRYLYQKILKQLKG